MHQVCRIIRAGGLALAASILGIAAMPAVAQAHAPFMGPVAPPRCHAGDRTERGLDGQLTSAERASGGSKRPYNCNLAIVGEYAGQGAGHQLLWYGHCAYVTTEGYEAGQRGVPPLIHPGIQVLDVSNPHAPRYVTHLDDPANCALTEHDITVTMGGYGYSVHDCTFDNPLDAKLLACSAHQAGIRVFDIHDPSRPREIAYFVGPAPPVPTEIDPGSLLNVFQGVLPPINFAWSKAHSRFVWRHHRLYLWVTSSHGGFYVLEFQNQAAIARLHPLPTPGNEDYQD